MIVLSPHGGFLWVQGLDGTSVRVVRDAIPPEILPMCHTEGSPVSLPLGLAPAVRKALDTHLIPFGDNWPPIPLPPARAIPPYMVMPQAARVRDDLSRRYIGSYISTVKVLMISVLNFVSRLGAPVTVALNNSDMADRFVSLFRAALGDAGVTIINRGHPGDPQVPAITTNAVLNEALLGRDPDSLERIAGRAGILFVTDLVYGSPPSDILRASLSPALAAVPLRVTIATKGIVEHPQRGDVEAATGPILGYVDAPYRRVRPPGNLRLELRLIPYQARRADGDGRNLDLETYLAGSVTRNRLVRKLVLAHVMLGQGVLVVSHGVQHRQVLLDMLADAGPTLIDPSVPGAERLDRIRKFNAGEFRVAVVASPGIMVQGMRAAACVLAGAGNASNTFFTDVHNLITQYGHQNFVLYDIEDFSPPTMAAQARGRREALATKFHLLPAAPPAA